MQKGLGKARVAVARKLGIRLWIMLPRHAKIQDSRRCSYCRLFNTEQL
jgi:hypothetical protein